MTKAKVACVIISAFNLIGAYSMGGVEQCFMMAMFLLLSLAMIWFGDEMGTGRLTMLSWVRTTPGSIVRVFGWILLLLPFFVFLLVSVALLK